MDGAELEAQLTAIDVAADPDGWALAAYRVAVARSELATTPEELDECVRLLEKAGRILTPDRAPLEHGRIATAVGHCHRSAGRADLAVEDFALAADLLRGRSDAVEAAAALVNVGLGRTETGRPADAIEPLGTAIELLSCVVRSQAADQPAEDDRRRTLGAALVNRAQARQAVGSADGLTGAVEDYEAAAEVLPAESPQAGMAWHGLATALLERGRYGDVNRAIGAIERSLSVFSVGAFPFQHAVARHSMAVALNKRATASNEPGDLARAVHHGEAALAIFDPRLHPGQWRAVHDLLAGIESQLGTGSRLRAVLDLLVTVDEDERTAILRDRLAPLAQSPDIRVDGDLSRLGRALTELDASDHQIVMRSLISVLMELPDRLLEHAARTLVAANASSVDPETYNRSLDDAVQARLFGPQRVRVRDLLEAHGWERP